MQKIIFVITCLFTAQSFYSLVVQILCKCFISQYFPTSSSVCVHNPTMPFIVHVDTHSVNAVELLEHVQQYDSQ